ncbi:MAG TPA: hypothetical protein VMS56_02930 [Thermoanaerobaculia bacterium]|nr:hypothetical protein [Thermoanaerobaculia bacterium]
MMRPIALALLGLLAAAPLLAWTADAEVRIAKKAASLAPPDLRMLILKYEAEYLAGVRDASAEERDAERHRERTAGGPFRREIDEQVSRAVQTVRRRDPMSELVYQLGTISHLVADANNPLRVGPSSLAPVERDYEAYFAGNLRKFPTVFYGLRDGFDVSGVIGAAFERSRRFNALLEQEYHREGRRRSSAEFDDRSTAFGIASVSYSRAVSDTVNVFFYVWKEAGGDVRTAEILRRGNLLLNENVR